MSVEPIGVLIAGAGLFVIVAGLHWGVYLLCISMLFGAAAAMILPALGGANIQPVHFALVFIVAAVALRPRTLAASLTCLAYPSPGFWFAVFTLYSVVTAFFLPRIFAGATIVYSLSRSDDQSAVILASPLAPGTGNVTQAGYMLGSLACFAVIGGFARLGGAPTVARAIVVAGALCVLFAIADVVTHHTGTAEVLSFMRNANYALPTNIEVHGIKRIVGSFPEASTYGSAALAFLSFILVLAIEGFPARFLGLIATALAATIVLCTSTTAYAASAVIAPIIFAFCIARILRRKASPRHLYYVGVCLVFVPLCVTAAMLMPSVWDSISNVVGTTVTNKLETQSGVERMRWNAQAFTSFFDTVGLGAGLGSIRASSFIAALAASVGLPGTILFLVFFASLIRSALRRDARRGPESAINLAALFACITMVTVASISGSAIDLSLYFAMTAGLVTAHALGPIAGGAEMAGDGMRWFVFPKELSGSGFRQAVPVHDPGGRLWTIGSSGPQSPTTIPGPFLSRPRSA